MDIPLSSNCENGKCEIEVAAPPSPSRRSAAQAVLGLNKFKLVVPCAKTATVSVQSPSPMLVLTLA